MTAFIAILIFFIFAIPNAQASDNPQMVQVFEPDEAFPLPYTLQMTAPAPSLERALRQFIFYEYYYYGFPHFGVSAALLLPLRWSGQIENTPLVMLVLRQGTSVLLMLAALMLLVYLQDGFNTYRSVALFIFLASVPAVVSNGFWWHPDGLVTLLAVLTLFFLERDALRLGRNFLLAAVTAAAATAAKNVGAYFFLAVGLVLFLSFLHRKATLSKVILMATAFLAVMGASYLLCNPFLLSQWGRTAFQNIFNKQTELLLEGYGITYGKGLAAAWPQLQEYYGEAIFILTVLATAVWGALRGPKRLLHALILAWFIPVSVMVLFITHFKFQYWLPVALPVFSCAVILLPEKLNLRAIFTRQRIVQAAALLVVLGQTGLFLVSDVHSILQRTRRAENEPALQFFIVMGEKLKPIEGKNLFIYYDARMYLPATQSWKSETTFELLDYTYIQQKGFDVLLLMEQRLRDYLQPGAVGVDQASFAQNQAFYRDADEHKVNGYTLIYRDDFGLVFVRDDYRSLFNLR